MRNLLQTMNINNSPKEESLTQYLVENFKTVRKLLVIHNLSIQGMMVKRQEKKQTDLLLPKCRTSLGANFHNQLTLFLKPELL